MSKSNCEQSICTCNKTVFDFCFVQIFFCRYCDCRCYLKYYISSDGLYKEFSLLVNFSVDVNISQASVYCILGKIGTCIKKVIQNIGVRVINYNICLEILYVLLCSYMFNLHTNVGLTAWFNNLQNTAIQTLAIVLIIFNKGLTYNLTRTRYEVITHVYKGYHSAFFLIINFMNENIFKPRHTCTKIQLIFFPSGSL